jgi:hypothetical protein
VSRDELRTRLIEEHQGALESFFARQKSAAATAVAQKAAAADLTSFDFELTGLLTDLGTATAKAVGDHTADTLGGKFDPSEISKRVAGNAKAAASRINETTAAEITKALVDSSTPRESIDGLFDGRVAARAKQIAVTRVTVITGIASISAAKQSGATDKTWTVNSGNPRDEHAGIDGETVPVGEPFSNGMDAPGDFSGGVDEVAGCTCSLDFT